MENENKDVAVDKKFRLCYGGLFIFTGLTVFAFSFFMGKSYEAILRNVIVSLIITGTVTFMLVDACSRGYEGFSYDNCDHKMRFVLFYAGMIILSCAFSLVPHQFWPYMALFVILALFSNNEIGIVSGIGFVMISVLLEENGSPYEIFMYALAGVVATVLFRELKEDTSVGMKVVMSLMMQAVLLMAFDVLFQNRTLSLKLLILPFINLMFNLVILMAFLNMFGLYVIRKSNDNYMEINDTEFPLLSKLRETNKDEYFRAIHTGYLAERIALGLGFNDRAVKNCSYYHRIGTLEGKTNWEDVEHIYLENNFPKEAVALLREFIENSKNTVKSKECLAVVLSETVIASIMYMVKKDKDAKIDYDQMIDKIFDKKEADGELKGYDITYGQYDQMRKILKKEKLYYDFLR